jgi:hypothetical protein
MAGDLRTLPQCICSVGMTVDGREVTKAHIDDIVETYNYNKYGARINLDHSAEFGGWLAKNYYQIDLNGGMLGDVMEVYKAKNDEGVLCLYAILSPNASFVLLNQSGQAVYYSVEIDQDFQGSGKTYLTGLATTDYPACCYTTRANFSSNKRQDNAIENFKSTLDFTDIYALTNSNKPPEKQAFSFKNLFHKKDDEEMNQAQFTQLQTDLTEPLTLLATGFSALTASMQNIETKFSKQDAGDDEQLSDKEKAKGGSAEFSLKDNEDFTKVTGQVNEMSEQITKLSTQLTKALGDQAEDTTDADDFNLGDNDKLNGIL